MLTEKLGILNSFQLIFTDISSVSDKYTFSSEDLILSKKRGYHMELLNLSVKDYLDELSKKVSTPGGGSALAIVLSLSASLGLMALNFTINKKGYEDKQEKVKEYILKFEEIKNIGEKLIDEDAKSYKALMDAYRKKDETAIRKAACYACEVPLTLYLKAKILEEYLIDIHPLCNKNLLSDVDIALDLINSVYSGSKANLLLNIADVPEEKKMEYLSLLK